MEYDKYLEFLHSKIEIAKDSGIKIDKLPDKYINFLDGTKLKPHQRDACIWAINGGRRALFESFGLGKTIQQLIICDYILSVECGQALIVAPLGVQQEFKSN